MSGASGPLTDAQAAGLTADSEPWLSCDDCFEQIDVCVDALLGEGRALGLPMRVHLARCPACREEAESLVTLLSADAGTSPDEALSALTT